MSPSPSTVPPSTVPPPLFAGGIQFTNEHLATLFASVHDEEPTPSEGGGQGNGGGNTSLTVPLFSGGIEFTNGHLATLHLATLFASVHDEESTPSEGGGQGNMVVHDITTAVNDGVGATTPRTASKEQ